MEGDEDCDCVSFLVPLRDIEPEVSHVRANPVARRRSHLPEGVKTKKWEDRMEKGKKEQAIKKLQVELKDEKRAEIQRCVSSPCPHTPSLHRLTATAFSCSCAGVSACV